MSHYCESIQREFSPSKNTKQFAKEIRRATAKGAHESIPLGVTKYTKDIESSKRLPKKAEQLERLVEGVKEAVEALTEFLPWFLDECGDEESALATVVSVDEAIMKGRAFLEGLGGNMVEIEKFKAEYKFGRRSYDQQIKSCQAMMKKDVPTATNAAEKYLSDAAELFEALREFSVVFSAEFGETADLELVNGLIVEYEEKISGSQSRVLVDSAVKAMKKNGSVLEKGFEKFIAELEQIIKTGEIKRGMNTIVELEIRASSLEIWISSFENAYGEFEEAVPVLETANNILDSAKGKIEELKLEEDDEELFFSKKLPMVPLLSPIPTFIFRDGDKSTETIVSKLNAQVYWANGKLATFYDALRTKPINSYTRDAQDYSSNDFYNNMYREYPEKNLEDMEKLISELPDDFTGKPFISEIYATFQNNISAFKEEYILINELNWATGYLEYLNSKITRLFFQADAASSEWTTIEQYHLWEIYLELADMAKQMNDFVTQTANRFGDLFPLQNKYNDIALELDNRAISSHIETCHKWCLQETKFITALETFPEEMESVQLYVAEQKAAHEQKLEEEKEAREKKKEEERQIRISKFKELLPTAVEIYTGGSFTCGDFIYHYTPALSEHESATVTCDGSSTLTWTWNGSEHTGEIMLLSQDDYGWGKWDGERLQWNSRNGQIWTYVTEDQTTWNRGSNSLGPTQWVFEDNKTIAVTNPSPNTIKNATANGSVPPQVLICVGMFDYSLHEIQERVARDAYRDRYNKVKNVVLTKTLNQIKDAVMKSCKACNTSGANIYFCPDCWHSYCSNCKNGSVNICPKCNKYNCMRPPSSTHAIPQKLQPSDSDIQKLMDE